jgi:hypothetical protein
VLILATRRVTATLLAMLVMGAAAQTPTTDPSDLWWNAGESGWGMQIVQGGNAAFATLFVYDSGGEPTFFTATLAADSATSWSGDLYRTIGPSYAAEIFDPARVIAHKVGTLSFIRTNADTGTLRYSVDGSTLSKNVSVRRCATTIAAATMWQSSAS